MLKTENWLLCALLASLIYGLWGFFPKLATRHLDPRSALVYETIGIVAVSAAVFVAIGFRPQVHGRGILFAVLTGISGMAGTLLLFHALSRGKGSVVLTITALYPLISILLAFLFLKEPVTLKQGVGMVLALVAMGLLAS